MISMRTLLYANDVDLKRDHALDDLEMSLRRMAELEHPYKPRGATTMRIFVRSYLDGSFEFDLQYGFTQRGNFVPLGDSLHFTSGELPQINSYVSGF